MAKIKIIADSTSYLEKEYIANKNITIVPLNYVFGGESFVEGLKGEFEEFYTKLRDTKLFPKTSQPSTGEFLEAFNKAFETYDEIMVIVLSSKISGTYSNAILAKNMLEDKKITIIDSETTVSNLRSLIENMVSMVEENKTSEEIEQFINQKKKEMKIFVTTNTLEYLSRGGRLSSVQSSIGNLLNIKPIIELKDGKLELLEKVRGHQKAIASIIDKIPEDVMEISICHILFEEQALDVKRSLEEKFPNITITVDEIGPVIGAHLGPETLGVCFY